MSNPRGRLRKIFVALSEKLNFNVDFKKGDFRLIWNFYFINPMGYNDSGRLLKHLREIEEAGEEVLSDKQEIVDLDRIRCQNREAIVRALSHLNENATLHFCAK